VDFGLAKIRGAEPSGSASKGLVSGTPDYMSPEQARALEVDGRGDLYALGVVMFELITGRLPFVGRSASEVMTAHVMDAPPDPAQLAPHRALTDPLRKVVLRSLAKSPSERYQDAEHMAQALRDAMPRKQAVSAFTACPECGSESEFGRKFCGECGTRLTAPSEREDTLTMVVEGKQPRTLLGRGQELGALDSMRKGVARDASPVAAYVYGPAGIGKTRVLQALAVLAERDGDVVVEAGVHPSGAPVAYAHIRTLVSALTRTRPSAIDQLLSDGSAFVDPLERAGLRELAQASGLPGVAGAPRHEAVALVLAHAITQAAERSRSGRVVLLLDDLDEADGLTSMVLAALLKSYEGHGLMCVVASRGLGWLMGECPGLALPLRGLDLALAANFVRSGVVLPALEDGGFSPLHAEQVRALQWEPSSGDPRVPLLADAVARRLDVLDASARRLLQTVSVLGNSAPADLVRSMLSFQDMQCLSQLTDAGLASSDGEHIHITHPFVRNLVHLSIPAETRRSMHRRALERASSAGAPLEQRVEYACGAGELMPSLMLLERMGDDAMQRGDSRLGVRAFRRALELSRRELLETGDLALDRAIATFSRRLGDALLRSGDTTQAAGVVREAIDLSGEDRAGHVQMLCVLAEVAAQRYRPAEARQLLVRARALAEQLDDSALRVRVELVDAALRQAEGDALGASNALLSAWSFATHEQLPSDEHALIGVQLAEALMDLGDLEAAREPLDLVLQVARSKGLAALSGRALGTLGSLDELTGEREAAQAYYEQAAAHAARAGDVAGATRWQRAAAVMASP